MEQKLNLTISKPCSEKFNQFNATEKGGVCNSCKKEVIDFRNMSDEKLANYFKNKSENTCGYFDTSQLSRTIQITEFKQPTRFKFLRVAALAFLSLTSLHNIQAQEQKNNIENVEQSKTTKNNKAKPQTQLLTGTITDNDNPLPGANILLKGTSIGTASDFDGKFEFPKTLNEGDILVISYLGFATQHIEIGKKQPVLNIVMQEDVSCVLMGEVEVNKVYEPKRTFWQKVKGIF